MPYPAFERLSPNRGGEAANERFGVVFHHTEMGFAETIEWMSRADSRVSYHCVIDADGTRCTLVPDTEIAWHAGASVFQGRTGCNAFMLGVSFAGDTYRAPLDSRQIASALEWLTPRWVPLGWTLDRMTDHRQVAPDRKRDLNPPEWERLRAAIAARFA